MRTRKNAILAEVKENLENQAHNGYKPSEDLRDEAGSMFDGTTFDVEDVTVDEIYEALVELLK